MKVATYSPYKKLDTVLENYAQRLKDTLKDNCVGVYLQGSLAIGDFDMASDVDFVVVINNDLNYYELRSVQKIHDETHKQNNRWVKRLEYSFFPKDKLNEISSPYEKGRENKTEERKLWYFDNGSKKIEKSDHDNTMVVRWTLRERGITLIGPEPYEIIMPIDPNILRAEIKETILGWGKQLIKDASPYKNRFYQSFIVLNFLRMLQDLYLGKVTSKLEAVEWSKNNIDKEWIDLINFCWKERQDTTISIKQLAIDKVFDRSINFVAHVLDKAGCFKIC